MTRSLFCCALIALAARPAGAQTSKPAAPASPAAQDALAKAWKQATANKVLKARVLEPRHFVARASSETYVVDVGGKQEAGGVTVITITMRRLSREGRIVFRYELDAEGRMRKFSSDEAKKSLTDPARTRTEVIEAVVADGQATVTRTRDGKPRKGGVFPWPADALPMVFAWFVIPSLHDQGIGRSLQLQAVLEERIRRIRLKPAPFARVTEGPESTPAGKVHRFEIGQGFLKATVEVAAEGKQAGQVRSVRVGKARHFVRTPAKEVRALLAAAPLFRKEKAAIEVLRQIYYAQHDLKRLRNKPYATKLEDLKSAVGTHQAIKAMERDYLILFRAVPDGSKWLAIAVPVEQGKTGRYFFAINQDGRVHSSETKLELGDDCAIPKGAKPHR